MRCLSLVLAVIVSSCAGIPADYRYDTTRPVGLAIGSITYESSIGSYELVARSATNGEEFRFRVGSSMWSPFVRFNDSDLGARGGTFAVELPSGDYRLIRWQVIQGYRVSRSETPFSIPLRIEQGRATYLGNLHFSEHWNEVTLRDRADRDLPILRKRYEVLTALPVAVAISKGTDIRAVGSGYTSSSPIIIPIPIRVQ